VCSRGVVRGGDSDAGSGWCGCDLLRIPWLFVCLFVVVVVAVAVVVVVVLMMLDL